MKSIPITPRLLLSAALLAGCDDAGRDTAVPPPLAAGAAAYEVAGTIALADRQPEEWADLHNVFRLSDDIISGSEPHGEAALERISGMGVKTILSVDGKAPDVETAAKYGMRYVHVPIQYSGITAAEQAKIAKTFRELEGPFYVHCFHGKHRGPAAAAVGRVVLDGVPREQAVGEMRQWCGTSEKYQGLYEAVGRAALPDASVTRELVWDFPAAETFVGLRQAMVGVSRPFDHLDALARRGWKADPEHPDLDAGNEARKLLEVLEATAALEELGERPADFRAWLAETLVHARALDGALANLATGAGDLDAVKPSFTEVKTRCTACHSAYRN